MRTMNLKFIFVSLILALIACSSKQTEIVQNSSKDEKAAPVEVRLGYNNLKLVGHITKNVQATYEERERVGCNDWNLEEKDLENILENMRQVESVEWNYLCYNYPCYYIGKAQNNESEYEIEINAASYIILRNGNEVLYFISENLLKYFLISCNCCEE
jgi:hypothetical protein